MGVKLKVTGLVAGALIAIVLLIGLFFTLKAVGVFTDTAAKNIIFENSYQKKASDKAAIATYDAELKILHRRLSSAATKEEKADIQAHIDAINVLKASKKD